MTRYLTAIDAAIEKAIRLRTLIRPRPELGEGLHSVKCGSHVAFLARANGDVPWIVVAVLHGSMDPKRHLPGSAENE